MFAARFDPTKQYEANDTASAAPSLPMKRSRDVEQDESESEMSSAESEDEAMQPDDEDQGAESKDDEDSVSNDIPAEEADKRHQSVLSRFQRTISIQDKLDTEAVVSSDSEEEPATMHGLVPIAQPAIVRDAVTPDSRKERKLLAWSNTTKIHYDSTMQKPFAEYKDLLSASLLANIEGGFSKTAFPIQTALLDSVLPLISQAYSVSKRYYTRKVGDILVNASTGSGKTLAYAMLLIHILSKRTVNRLRAVILVPTKLLVHQVYDTVQALAKGSSVIVAVSKMDTSLKEESAKLKAQEPDVLIITPGRLVDHLNMQTFSLKNLKFLVLDEADRLLNQSFQNWCTELMAHLDTERPFKGPGNVIKMIFSATLTTNTERLHDLQLHNPKLFLMGSQLYHMPAQLQEYNLPIPTSKSYAKPLIFLRMLPLLSTESPRILVFVKSNEASIRLAALLTTMVGNGLSGLATTVASINNNNSRAANRKLIEAFATGTPGHCNILVSTDLMSRGLDISGISHVVNYDLPISSQQYVHRCGRTARANTSGTAVNLLVGKGEQKFWREHIDSDLSRAPEGSHILFFDDEQREQLVSFSEEDIATYKKCLDELKNSVLGR
ncbi:AaceriAGL225Cp [[Ashbya] aceris (nom. inval.)]|nr:AaceriAGL225Cp [[Ashbya] aceris (nom. inval.)]